MSELDPIIKPEKDISKEDNLLIYKRLFLTGIIVGSGLTLTTSALLTLLTNGFLKEILLNWSNIPVPIWCIFFLFFLGLFLWVYKDFNTYD